MAITDSLRERATGTTSISTETTSKKTLPETEQLSTEEFLEKELEIYSMLTFWYGLKPAEIVEMPVNILRSYVNNLPALLSEYQNMLIIGASYPYMKENDQKKVMRQLEMAKRRMTPADEARQLSEAERVHNALRMGLGFQTVPIEPNGANGQANG